MANQFLKTAVVFCAAWLAMTAGVRSEEKKAPPPARVVTAPLVKESLEETVKVVGTLYFDRVSQLATEVSGLVSSVHFKEGDHVSKGDLMIRMNTDFIDNEMATVTAELAQIRVRLDKAEKDLVRYKTLFSQDAASEQEYDNIVLSREDLAMQLNIRKKSLELAALKKEKSHVKAPFDGVILEKMAEIGSWVSPGNHLCTLGALDDLYVKASVSEDLLAYSRDGQAVEVIVPALGKTFEGILSGLIPVADPKTKAVFVKVKIPRLKTPVLNMAAVVYLPASEKKEMLLVPRDALINYNGKQLIYTIKDGKAAPIPVTIASYVGDRVAVTGLPLPPGAPLVVDGNDRLRPGQAVVVISGPGADKQ